MIVLVVVLIIVLTLFVVVLAIFVMVLITVLTIFVVVLALFVVVLLVMVVLREGHVVGTLVAVKFTGVFGMLGKDVDIRGRWLGKETTEFRHHHGLVVKVNFSGWKSVG